MAYPNADSYNITQGAETSGSLSDTNSDNSTYLILAEIKNATPAFDYDFTFSSVPSENYTINLNGYYADSPAHTVLVYVWNYSSPGWDRMTAAANDMPQNSTDQDYSWPNPATQSDHSHL